ncbi:MAG: hypothetical protein JWO82_1846 [Akkermansiaceae bacterium]|nr:hypothetical protein [Akkermansiaceae bacterium]
MGMLSGRETKKYKIRLLNHGHEFEVTTHKDLYSMKPWIKVRTGEMLEIEMDPSETGFQASNAVSGPTERGMYEPINATITFMGLPAELESNLLIESYSDGL